MAESISEGTLKSWTKKEGDTVAVDEEVATIETDKVRFFPFRNFPMEFDFINRADRCSSQRTSIRKDCEIVG